jgi:hypothetical protein
MMTTPMVVMTMATRCLAGAGWLPESHSDFVGRSIRVGRIAKRVMRRIRAPGGSARHRWQPAIFLQIYGTGAAPTVLMISCLKAQP